MTTPSPSPVAELRLSAPQSIAGPAMSQQFSDLLDRSFGLKGEQRFLADFPVWDEGFAPPGETLRRLGIFATGGEARRLVASAAVRLAMLRLTGVAAPVPVAVIGAVATDDGFRDRGLASRLVETAVSWASARGAAMALLWGSEHSLYRKLGFELCGSQARLPVRDLLADRATTVSAASEAVRRGWDDSLFGLLRSRPEGLLHAEADLNWFAAHRNVAWYWTTDALGAPRACLALGRGIDLPGCVHEWAVAPGVDPRKALVAPLDAALADCPEAVMLGTLSQLARLGSEDLFASEEFLALVRVLDPVRLFRAAHASLDVSAREIAPLQWEIRLGSAPANRIGARELARLLFGGPGEASSAPGLPLPLWAWGLDSA